jgi:hypothetical protein
LEKRLSVFDIEASPEASDLLHGLQEGETSPDTVEGNLEALNTKSSLLLDFWRGAHASTPV